MNVQNTMKNRLLGIANLERRVNYFILKKCFKYRKKIPANWIELFFLLLWKVTVVLIPVSNYQAPSASKVESTQFQSQAFASPLTSFGMTHCNFLIKKLILGVKCQEKMRKRRLLLWRLEGFWIWAALVSYLSNQSPTEASLMFPLCSEVI